MTAVAPTETFKKKMSTKKSAVAKPKTPSAKPTHPPTSEMVRAAISALAGKKGSSNAAIKKYIAANYVLDLDKIIYHINRYLRSAVVKGDLIRVKGQGASGVFKLPQAQKKSDTKKTDAKKKLVQEKKAKDVKKEVESKTAKPVAKKSKKSPVAKKPKTPKPKKVSASAKARSAKK